MESARCGWKGCSPTRDRRGFWQRVMEASDATGEVVGEFMPRDIRRGGRLRWGSRGLTLRPVSPLRERYVLNEDDRDLVVLDGKGWGRRPVKITLAKTRGDRTGAAALRSLRRSPARRQRRQHVGGRLDNRWDELVRLTGCGQVCC